MDDTPSAAPGPLVGLLRRSLLWGENLSLRSPKAWSNGSSPLPRMACPLASGHDRCAPCGTRPIHSVLRKGRQFLTFCIRSPVKPSPREPATVAPMLSPQVRAGDRQLPQYLWGRRRRPGTHPLHRFGQPGVDQSKTFVRLCEPNHARHARTHH